MGSTPMLTENRSDRLPKTESDRERTEKCADVHPGEDHEHFRAEIRVGGSKIDDGFTGAKRSKDGPVEQSEPRDRTHSGDVGEDRVFDQVPEVEISGWGAETAQQGAHVKVLAKFKDGNGTIDKRKGEAKNACQNIAPL